MGGGNSSSQLNYTLIDTAQNEGSVYYRLKQTDYDGIYKYETIIGVHKCKGKVSNLYTIYPNPSNGKFVLFFNGNPSEINSIDIFNSLGQNIYSSTNFQSTFDLSHNVPGSYYMCIQQNSNPQILKLILSN